MSRKDDPSYFGTNANNDSSAIHFVDALRKPPQELQEEGKWTEIITFTA